MVSLPLCNSCHKQIKINQHFITCNICKHNFHTKCLNIDKITYEKMRNNEDMLCLKCNEELLPFFPHRDELTKSNDLHLSDSIKLFFKEINTFHNDKISDEDDNFPPINCSYVDTENYHHKNKPHDFSLFHLNIASLGKHKDELEATLGMLHYNFDVIGLTETKIIKGIPPVYDTSLVGYKIYDKPTEAEKGGDLLYVAKHLKSIQREDLNSMLYKSKQLESSFVEIDNSSSKNIICASIYRHPSMDLECFNQNYLIPLLDKILKENKQLFLMGDFNADLLKIEIDQYISNHFDIITSYLLVPHIIYPTRITENTKSLIDNIYSNSINFQEGISGNITISISDHLAQFLIIPLKYDKISEKHNLFRRDMKNFVKDEFIRDLTDANLNNIVINQPNLNEAFNNFEDKINIVINKHMPLKKLTKRDLKQKLKPWITKGILISMKRRDKLYKKYINCKNILFKNVYFENYKQLRNMIVNLCRNSKRVYFNQFFTENANNIRNTWKGIKSIINIKSTENSEPITLIDNKEILSDPKRVANSFNTYFSTIAGDLQEKMHYTNHDFHHYLTNRNENSFFLSPTNKYEIIDIITSIDIDKAVGPHSIPSNILHLIKDIISEPLSNIINHSFEKGIYLDNLKIAKTIPIYKGKGSKLCNSNYRPISLLSNINKIIEKLMFKRLYKFLIQNKCIYELQFGFRKNHSTNHALINLTEDIRNALDNKQFAVGIFVDLQKAFDTVDHNILIQKLEHYGIRGVANDWIKSYLTNRKQFVSINGFNSKEVNMDYGVPQGSILGPLLFLIYINDLNYAIKFCTTRLFADDTCLIIKNKCLKQLKKHLNLDLRNLCRWLRANKISLNKSKTEMLLFRHPNKKINYNLKIKIEGRKLLPSKFVKYLGIYIDPYLKWNHHIDVIAPKLSRACGMLMKIRHFVPPSTLLSIYYGIFSSILTYGCQVINQMQNIHTNRLQRIQDRAVRIINFAKYNDHRDPLYFKLKILKIRENVHLLNFLFVHDCINKNIPEAFQNSFVSVNDLHNYNTRNATNHIMALPRVYTTFFGIMSITYQSTSIWNTINLKLNIKFQDKSKSCCKRLIRGYLVEKYS